MTCVSHWLFDFGVDWSLTMKIKLPRLRANFSVNLSLQYESNAQSEQTFETFHLCYRLIWWHSAYRLQISNVCYRKTVSCRNFTRIVRVCIAVFTSNTRDFTTYKLGNRAFKMTWQSFDSFFPGSIARKSMFCCLAEWSHQFSKRQRKWKYSKPGHTVTTHYQLLMYFHNSWQYLSAHVNESQMIPPKCNIHTCMCILMA